MAEYEESQRIKDLAERLIKEHHTHLSKAKIAYLMKGGEVDKKIAEPTRGKIPKVGKARKMSDLVRFLSGYDFAIEISQALWDLMPVEAQEALIDHELCHCGFDEKGAFIKDHPITEFPEIVRRHGLWTTGLGDLAETIVQLNLFADPEAKQEAAAAVH